MRSMTKGEIARAAGVSRKTLMKWLKDPFIANRLAALHINPHQYILPPAAVEIICEHYAIEID